MRLYCEANEFYFLYVFFFFSYLSRIFWNYRFRSTSHSQCVNTKLSIEIRLQIKAILSHTPNFILGALKSQSSKFQLSFTWPTALGEWQQQQFEYIKFELASNKSVYYVSLPFTIQSGLCFKHGFLMD